MGRLKLAANLEAYFRALRKKSRAACGEQASDGGGAELSSINQHVSLPGIFGCAK
jgi:hypothetical protein